MGYLIYKNIQKLKMSRKAKWEINFLKHLRSEVG